MLWLLEGDDADKHVYVVLGKTASNILKLRKAFYRDTKVNMSIHNLVSLEEELIKMEFNAVWAHDNTRILQAMKRICAMCGKQVDKTWRCASCSCRYCSTTCQSEHWDTGHKQKCPGIRKRKSMSMKQLSPHV